MNNDILLPADPGKMNAMIVLLVPLLFSFVSAQTFHWGPCPTPMVQPNFELDKVGIVFFIHSLYKIL